MAVARPEGEISEAEEKEFINIHQKLELLWVLCKYFSGDDGEVILTAMYIGVKA
jgi:hypothetical protein